MEEHEGRGGQPLHFPVSFFPVSLEMGKTIKTYGISAKRVQLQRDNRDGYGGIIDGIIEEAGREGGLSSGPSVFSNIFIFCVTLRSQA